MTPLARMAALRRRIGAFFGGAGFEGASNSRRLQGLPAARDHINRLMEAAGPTLTARARYLIRNNGYARNAVRSWTSNTVGAGIVPNSQAPDAYKAEIEDAFLYWTSEADADGRTDFYGLESEISWEWFAAGEAFARFRPRRPVDGLSVPLQIQLIPCEMLPLNLTEDGTNGFHTRQGITFNPIGQRASYRFYRTNPNDRSGFSVDATELTTVPAEDVCHVFRPDERGQIRGFSQLAPAILKLFVLDLFNDAELERKKNAAMMVYILKLAEQGQHVFSSEDQLNEAISSTVARFNALEPGGVAVTEGIGDIKVTDPADSGNSYEPFQYRTLLEISAALGIPYAYLTNDVDKANYSNARTSLLEFRRACEQWQHNIMVEQFCRPLWARWMDTAVLSGRLRLPNYEMRRRDYLACEWRTQPWPWVDPLKDIAAEEREIALGVKSRTQACAERGVDYEKILQERQRERMLEEKYGEPPRDGQRANLRVVNR